MDTSAQSCQRNICWGKEEHDKEGGWRCFILWGSGGQPLYQGGQSRAVLWHLHRRYGQLKTHHAFKEDDIQLQILKLSRGLTVQESYSSLVLVGQQQKDFDNETWFSSSIKVCVGQRVGIEVCVCDYNTKLTLYLCLIDNHLRFWGSPHTLAEHPTSDPFAILGVLAAIFSPIIYYLERFTTLFFSEPGEISSLIDTRGYWCQVSNSFLCGIWNQWLGTLLTPDWEREKFHLERTVFEL